MHAPISLSIFKVQLISKLTQYSALAITTVLYYLSKFLPLMIFQKANMTQQLPKSTCWCQALNLPRALSKQLDFYIRSIFDFFLLEIQEYCFSIRMFKIMKQKNKINKQTKQNKTKQNKQTKNKTKQNKTTTTTTTTTTKQQSMSIWCMGNDMKKSKQFNKMCKGAVGRVIQTSLIKNLTIPQVRQNSQS